MNEQYITCRELRFTYLSFKCFSLLLSTDLLFPLELQVQGQPRMKEYQAKKNQIEENIGPKRMKNELDEEGIK